MITSSSIVHKVSPGLAPDVQVIEQCRKESGCINVAAYCRVSTNLDSQKQSLETQMEAFNQTIAEHPGWVLAGIYADRGISGTSVRQREEFLRMIEDAKAGKIQYILVKSISRFARNTVDALSYVRELKNHGVSVYFSKERIDTGNIVSEFLLSILAASAQEEIISLSNNMKVGRRMRFASGIVQWSNIYGYRKGENGEWVIHEEEAKLIRRIFSEYVEGRTIPEICKGLEADGIPTMSGKQKWYAKGLATVLHNEKYAGDILMQKSYVSDPIAHTRVDNREAKIKQYFKEGHHPAIVDKETFNMAAMIAVLRDSHRGITQYPYYGFLKCPLCGENMLRFGHPRNDHTHGWTCGGKPSKKGNLRRHRTVCPPYYIIEPYIDYAFWDALKAIDEEALKEIARDEEAEKAGLATAMMALRWKTWGRKKQVGYKTLHDLVERITFPQWTTMRVEWKIGLISDAHIEYKTITDQPYPIITRELAERKTLTKGVITTEAYIVNGVPVFSGCPALQVGSIKKARDELMDLIILEPRVYEPPVPRVYGAKSISSNDDPELAAARKMIEKSAKTSKKAAKEE